MSFNIHLFIATHLAAEIICSLKLFSLTISQIMFYQELSILVSFIFLVSVPLLLLLLSTFRNCQAHSVLLSGPLYNQELRWN